MRDPINKPAISMLMVILPVICGCAQPTGQRPANGNDTQVAAAAATENMLGNPGFEAGDPTFAPWSMNVHADPESYEFTLDTQTARQGTHSLRIERRRDEPFANVVQHFQRSDLANRKFRLSAWVRGENLVSPVYLHAIPFNHGQQGGIQGGSDRGLTGSFDWTRLALDIQLPERVSLLEVGVTTTGDGILWIDDAELIPLPD